MKKLFRPRNLLILLGLGIIVGVVLSKKNTAPAPAYPDPWAAPSPTAPEASETGTSPAPGSTTKGAETEPAASST